MDTDAIERDLLGKELCNGLRQSFAERSARGGHIDVDPLAASAAVPQLNRLLAEANELEVILRDRLLAVLALLPPGRVRAQAMALRASALLATPAVSDLIMLPVRPGLLQELNPYLSAAARAAITRAAQDWQGLCVLSDTLQRCLLCTPGAEVGAADGQADRTLARLASDLCNDTAERLDHVRYPAWLAFQARCSPGVSR